MRLKALSLSPVLASAILLAACAREPRANVILIVVDTLRADHLSLAGYARPTSPRLAEYARRGVYFDRFHSHSSWTRSSVATLLTSLLPGEHGVVSSAQTLSPSLETLPERLRFVGYRTLAFVANPQIHPALGFDQGFERFFELYRLSIHPGLIVPDDVAASASDAEVLARAFSVLREERTSPYFAYVHLLDPHGPYSPEAADAAEFSVPGYRGPITGSIADFANLTVAPPGPDDLAQFEGLYDAEIRGTDRDLGVFLDALDRDGLLANTHVLVTSDHGEEFLEHGGTGHGRKLHEEQIHVPLLWIGPGIPQGRIVHQLAGLIDLAPTLLDVLGVGKGRMDPVGRSLRPLWEEAEERRAQPVLLEEFSGEEFVEDGRTISFVHRGMLTVDHKLLIGPLRADRRSGGAFSVFDLAADPGEHSLRPLPQDRATWSPEDAALVALWQLLDRRAASHAAGTLGVGAPAADLPAEDRERLRSLGYIQ